MAIDLPHFDMDGLRRRVASIDLPDAPDLKLPDIDLQMPDLSGARSAVGEGVDALGQRLDDLGKEIRQIRVVRGPEPRVGPAAGIALLGGMGLGMAIMYFLDPRVGAARRNALKERIMGLAGGMGRRDQDDWWEGDTTEAYGNSGSRMADEAIGGGTAGTAFGGGSTDTLGASTTDIGFSSNTEFEENPLGDIEESDPAESRL